MSEEPTKKSHPGSELLSPVEAAHFLGVTPELLFAYAVYPPKKAIGDGITLEYTSDGGRSGFLKADLESFDNYLREPWTAPGALRPPLPSYIGDYLKVECGGQCARCGRGYKLENAHIVPYAESRSHHHHNLIRLCVECHEEFETKRLIPYSEVNKLKQQLIAGIRDRLLPRMDAAPIGLGRMPNPASQFVGREHDLGVLVEALRQKRSVSIEGPGGIGKTQLLLNALQFSLDTRPVLWMNLEAYNTVYDLKQAMSSALSEPGSTVATRSIVALLANAEVRLVFDGVEQMSPADMDEVEDFFGTLLTMTSAPQLIFTSQVKLFNLDLEKRLLLEPLSIESSLLVLQSSLSPELRCTACEAKGLSSLVAFCQGHPLSLQITSGLIRHFESTSAVLERVRQSGGAAIQNPTRHRQNTHTSLCACLLVSYQTLTANQCKLLWLASQCPAGFLTDKANAATFGIEDIMTDIASLRRWHLIDVDAATPFCPRLYVLSPIRAFVNAEFQAEKSGEIEELEYLLVMDLTIQAGTLDNMYFQVGDVRVGLLRFDIELPNFMNALRAAVERGSERCLNLAALMASSLMVYCFVSGLVQRGVEIMQIGADAAIRVGNIYQASEILTRLLLLAARSFEVEVIKASAERLDYFAKDSVDPVIVANSLFGRGMVALIDKQLHIAGKAFEAAASEYEKAIQTAEYRRTQAAKGEADSLRASTDWTLHMLALALKKQGSVHESARRPAEALPYYERALTIMLKGSKDQINIGSILHHIGNCCAANSNQGERALNSYLAAAKQFHSIQFEEYLSNSLAELGYLLIEWDPPSSVDDFIQEDLIADGLSDAARQVQRLFKSLASVVPSENHLQTVRKVFGIIALASFSSHNHLLADWAYCLREEVLRPLLIEVDWETSDLSKRLLVMHLDLTLAIAGTLSEVEQPNALGPFPTLAEVEHIARLCYKYFDWGWNAFHPFEWLATYLRRHRGALPIQPDVLRSAAEEAETLGHEFSVVL